MSIQNIFINKCRLKKKIRIFIIIVLLEGHFTQRFPEYLVFTIFISDGDSYHGVHLKFTVHFNSVPLVLMDLHKNQWCPSNNIPLALMLNVNPLFEMSYQKFVIFFPENNCEHYETMELT